MSLSLFWLGRLRRIASSYCWAFDQSHQKQQDNGPDGCDDQAPDQSAARRNAEQAEDETSQ
jgi:hypothetical protein